MKKLSLLLLLILPVGCISSAPFASKSSMGNLEINVQSDDAAAKIKYSEIFIDGIFVGNVSANRPVLNLRAGKHEIKVQLKGLKPYVKTIQIAGNPNHQVLNVLLEK